MQVNQCPEEVVMSGSALPLPHSRLLDGIPAENGWPLLGQTLRMLRDPQGLLLDMHERLGPVARSRFFGLDTVVLTGPDANQLVFRNGEDAFSNGQGWEFFIERFFRRGLMLLDGDEHRFHRGIMQAAFKKPCLVDYLEQMNPAIARGLATWRPGRRFLVYPHLKQLALDIATEVFMGEQLGPEADRINQAFVDAVRAGSALIRHPVPGLRWQKGLAGRAVLEDFFRSRLPARRSRPGTDLFSRLCQAEDEEGSRFSDDDVINHMIFLMMAAHDTTTITLSNMIYFLARHPVWQDKLRH
ncbi:MAG: cytochrome P450, partial [Perlucidibaca sp.]